MKRFTLVILLAGCCSLLGQDMFPIRKAGGNAAVPGDAPIQPPQAFVDAMTKNNASAGIDGVLDFSNSGVTAISSSYFDVWVANNGLPDLNASGDALTTAAVNAILAEYAAHVGVGLNSLILDLSGGTSGAPAGQGLTDKAFLISNGWTVTTN